MARGGLRLHPPDAASPPKERMLRFARALGFLAPLAVTLCAAVVLVLSSGVDALGRSWVLSAVFLAALAGMTTTALVAWSYMGWRLNRLARTLEATITEAAPGEAAEVAERLRSVVAQTPLTIATGQAVNVTISIGIAGGRGHELLVDSLVDQADAAMYAAKGLGRNRIYLYRDLDEGAAVPRAPISPESRAAAAAIGQWASDTAAEALASVLAPQPHHRGRPSDMIASLATGIALHLQLPPAEIDRVRIASLLHDLGKLAVPAEILDKPTSLSNGEWQAIGEHPRIGQLILEQASSLRDAIPVVLHHHERFNGTGYPHGLSGQEIPLGARIVAVADAYHAMVHERPYKEALTHIQALHELEANAGTQFDPDVVAIFCSLYVDGVPPDGLEEVYRLHERARGGLKRLDPRAAAARLAGEGLAAHDHGHAEPAPAPEAEAPRRRTQRRAEQVQNAAG